MIECTSVGCATIANNEGYFIDGSDSSKIISCKDDVSTGFICTSNSHGGSNSIPKYYVNNATDKKLIKCNSTGCTIIPDGDMLKGYFLNGAGTTGKSLIKCDGSECTEEDDTNYKSLSAIGKVKVATSGVSICVDVGCSGAGEVKIKAEASNADPIYKSLKLASNSDFPGASSTDITVKIGKDGSVILLEELNGLTGTCTSNIYCYDSTIKKIKYNANEDSDIITKSTAGTYIYYFNNQNTEAENVPVSGTINDVFAYQCTFIETDDEDADDNRVVVLDTCKMIKGFAIDGSKTVQCSGWKHEGCTISSSLKACEEKDEGRLGSNKKICFGTTTYDLPKTSNDATSIVFLSSEINTNFGKPASSVINIEITPNSVLYESISRKLK